MRIMVTDSYNNVIYENIEAEDYLFENDDAYDLEDTLNLLEHSKTGDSVIFFDNDEEYTITKLEDDSLYDDTDF